MHNGKYVNNSNAHKEPATVTLQVIPTWGIIYNCGFTTRKRISLFGELLITIKATQSSLWTWTSYKNDDVNAR